MIIFDVDGTLIGGESTDWKCFDKAFEESSGTALTSELFSTNSEMTAQAIVHQALGDMGSEEKKEIEIKTCSSYVRNLNNALNADGGAFPVMPGARELMQSIQETGIPIAIATGNWRESALVKLDAAGICLGDIPLVTASDYYSRSDIIRAAIEKAGERIKESVYVGDGVWDLLATRKIGISFIGCGTRTEELRDSGAKYILDDFDIECFWNIYREITESNK